MTKKAKIWIGGLSALTIVVPSVVVPSVLLINNSSQPINDSHNLALSTKFDPVEITVPQTLLPGVNEDREKFDTIKREQSTFNESTSNDGDYVLSNRWTKIVFSQSTLGANFFNGKENAKKFAIMATSMVNYSSVSLLFPTYVDVKETYSAPVSGGSAISLSTGLISREKEMNKVSDEAFILAALQVFIHENGHSISKNNIKINKRNELNEFGEFVSNSNENDLKGITKQSIIDKSTQQKDTTAVKPFSNLSRWIGSEGINEYIFPDGFHNASEIIDGNPELESASDVVINDLFEEIFTRINVSYTQKLDYGVLKNFSLPILQNQADVYNILNYNFFDENDSLQAYNVMKALLSTYWGIDGIPVLSLTSGLSFKCDGGEKTKDITTIKLFDVGGNEIKNSNGTSSSFKPNHDDIALGFNRNPFMQDYSYKYVADTVWYKQDKIDFDLSVVDHAKAYDASGGEIPLHVQLSKN